MCGGVCRRGLGDDAVVDGADDGFGGVFAGKSTAVAGLLLFTIGGVAESLIEHFYVWTSRTSPGRYQTKQTLRRLNALDARMLDQREMSRSFGKVPGCPKSR